MYTDQRKQDKQPSIAPNAKEVVLERGTELSRDLIAAHGTNVATVYADCAFGNVILPHKKGDESGFTGACRTYNAKGLSGLYCEGYILEIRVPKEELTLSDGVLVFKPELYDAASNGTGGLDNVIYINNL